MRITISNYISSGEAQAIANEILMHLRELGFIIEGDDTVQCLATDLDDPHSGPSLLRRQARQDAVKEMLSEHFPVEMVIRR